MDKSNALTTVEQNMLNRVIDEGIPAIQQIGIGNIIPILVKAPEWMDKMQKITEADKKMYNNMVSSWGKAYSMSVKSHDEITKTRMNAYNDLLQLEIKKMKKSSTVEEENTHQAKIDYYVQEMKDLQESSNQYNENLLSMSKDFNEEVLESKKQSSTDKVAFGVGIGIGGIIGSAIAIINERRKK